jgi:replicative DNA helicase
LELIKLRALLHIQKFAEWDGNDNIDGMMGGGSWKPISPSSIGGGNPSEASTGGKFFVQGSKMNNGDFDEGFDGDAPF